MSPATAWTEREIAVIVGVQRALPAPAIGAGARFASHWGEHSLGWFAVAGTGIALSPSHRSLWLRAGAAAFVAHLGAVSVKRLVKRPRPSSGYVRVGVGTPSRLSFPSAHAASTTAFVTAALPVIPLPAGMLIIGAMCTSRVLLGVHYPTDVLAGAALGVASAAAVRRLPDGRRA